MKTKLALAGVGILLVILALAGWYLYNKPHTGVAGIDADIITAASGIYGDFQKDEATANKKYLNKVVEVTGSVADIQKENGSLIILLSSNDPSGGVSCKFSNAGNVLTIAAKKSTTVTIKGKCSGYLMDVNLVDCILK